MNPFEIDQTIQKEKENTYEMSSHVRQKLDKTYQMIQDMPLKKSKNRFFFFKHKGMAVATASMLLGIGTFCSGFVSPTMAEGIKKVPLIGGVFQSLEQDLGLQQASQKGWIQAVQSENAFQNLKLQVSESIFDGTRAAMVVHVEGLNIQEGQVVVGNEKKKLTNTIESMQVEVNGKPFLQGASYEMAGPQHPDAFIVQLAGADERPTMNVEEYTKLPNEFQAKLKIQFEGVNHVFELNVPVQKTISSVVQMQPQVQQIKDDQIFTVSKVTATPVTTHVVASFTAKDFKFDAKKQIRVAAYDENGKPLEQLDSTGEINKDSYTLDINYISNGSIPKKIVLKPYIDADNSRKATDTEWIDGLPIEIQLENKQ
ncbi:DUF4179 domain-containing protein [Bacillus cereus]|uniref:DUF4179 domain-containing protein n=1 Tax=Bacillus cereus TaxID=1396 RepID=A0AAW5L2Z1_BACCE|nr:DUF4179 domain-containing protein [Bacillus cereus]MCQ6288538.1 DUF4179 domain-containing protein [Bacillus cereus]MCQ6307034.1 DUF4179 domain-containing protein [Bacillus cereus]MCQ6317852.1 DUF4179 domain-containing protein [Bacillus cereus]MCQ6328968.1 DUF4179 domain-containing protein [Bacillus cereus]MCQ6385714.1 DUF4179 domain-containing protein [Bacillus cereus]